jgi:hypothetical protein
MGSWDGGGYTWDGPRSGGIDGKGGKLSLLHPSETVIDHAKGQTVGGTTNNISIVVNQDGNSRSQQSDSSAAAQLGKRIESAVRQVLAQEKRPGGMLTA